MPPIDDTRKRRRDSAGSSSSALDSGGASSSALDGGAKRRRRVSFGKALAASVDGTGCSYCEVDVRADGGGKYYPASKQQRLSGQELQRVATHEADSSLDPSADSGAFCDCKDSCRSNCPCAAHGVGCWWEGWGCGCQGVCSSAVAPHIFNDRKVRNERRRKLSSQGR